MTETKTLTVADGVASLLAVQNPESKTEDQEELQDTQATETDDPEEEETPEEVEDPDADPEGEDPTEEDVPDEVEPFYEVTVDGEAKKLKLKDLIDGYRRGHNYETKAEKLREERQATERERAEVTQRRTEYDQRLSALEAILSQEDPDLKTLKERDPTRYLIVKQEREEALKKVQDERQRVATEYRSQMHAEMLKHVAAEKQKLLEAVPAWRDEKRAKAEQPKVTAFAKSIGFTDQELAGLTDHRAVVVLRDAWLYRQGRDLKGKQTQKASKQLPAGKPQTKEDRTGRERDRALERLKREGSVSAGVAALLARK
ncbi:MAG: hypothetical protein WC869_11975 [Phycisphaerae bacterium]|jgi:hypothetical protein